MSNKTTSDKLEAEITARMANGEPFTFQQLYVGKHERAYRLADRLIQKWRRKGWIEFSRVGRGPVWRLTDEGRTRFAKEIVDNA